MRKTTIAVFFLTISMTLSACGQQTADIKGLNEEINELKDEMEELKEENNELKAKIYDYENGKAEQSKESSELDGFVVETSGVCGADLKWEYGNGTLRISGTGEMTDFYYDEIPWYEIRDKIVHVYIEEGCTLISDTAFSGCKNMSKAVIPSSLDRMYINSYGTSQNISITIPNNVSYFGVSEDYGIAAPTDGTELSEEYVYDEYKKITIYSIEEHDNITWTWRDKEYTSNNAEELISDLEAAGIEWH